MPMPLGCKGSDRLPKTREVLKNCFNTQEGHILPRPGITSLGAVTGVARGHFVWNGSRYAVYSECLYKLATDGSTTLIGTVEGSAPIDTAIGFNHAVIISRQTGGKGYTLDSSDTLTEITDAQFEASNSVTHINGRFVFIPFDGDPAFFSDVGDGSSIQTTAFFDAEELPDKNKVAFNLQNILFIGGTDSFEQFREVSGGTIPYRRLSSRIHNGYIGAIIEYAGSFAFIGREKGEDVGIYYIGQGAAPKISNEYIDSILTTYTEAELALAVPGRFKWRGYDLLTFTLERDAFGFYRGQWFLLETLLEGERFPWQAGFITHFEQKYYTASGSKQGRLDQINTDYGNPIERVISSGYYHPENDDFTAGFLEMGISQGYTSTGTVGLKLSRDNVLYSSQFFRSTGDAGDYSDKLVWSYPGGLGYYPGFMGWEITTTADIEFACDKMTIR